MRFGQELRVVPSPDQRGPAAMMVGLVGAGGPDSWDTHSCRLVKGAPPFSSAHAPLSRPSLPPETRRRSLNTARAKHGIQEGTSLFVTFVSFVVGGLLHHYAVPHCPVLRVSASRPLPFPAQVTPRPRSQRRHLARAVPRQACHPVHSAPRPRRQPVRSPPRCP